VVVCDKLPDVAVTVIVEVPAGVPVGVFVQPAIPTAAISTIATNSAGASCRLRFVLRIFNSP